VDSIQLSQSDVTVTGPTATACAVGSGPNVFVYGGTPPYTVYNSLPAGMTLDKSRVQDSGDSFTISFLGVCMQTMPITVQDSMGRLATVTVTNQVQQSSTSASSPS
jgi:hypothetical protein